MYLVKIAHVLFVLIDSPWLMGNTDSVPAYKHKRAVLCHSIESTFPATQNKTGGITSY